MSEKLPVTSSKFVYIGTWLNENTARLKAAGIDSARLDCLLLLGYVLKKPREWILAHLDEKINASYLLELNTKIVQRIARKPLVYLTNHQEFYGRNFYVNESVLIPRPESESIITLLKSYYKESPCNVSSQLTTIIDIGTGSGCLAVTAKLEIPEAQVIATDNSPQALKVAKKNARVLGAEIHFHQADLLNLPPGILNTTTCILLANLPYVPDDLITSPEITREPKEALFSGQDGLDHYRRFWQQVSALETKPFAIITESLKTQHKAMAKHAEYASYKLSFTDCLAQLFTTA